MFKFSSKTQVDKVFKIKELFKLVKADKAVKTDAECIEKITLSNVISTDTINMKSQEECKEIYIFQIELKEKYVPLCFIKKLDESIKLHTYFILKHGELVKELCIHRTVKEESIKFGKAYESVWKKQEIRELPYCSSIMDVYKNLVFQLIPIKPWEEEELEEFIERYTKIQKLKKEIESLERKANGEKQPRKKFDLGREIRILQQKLMEIEGKNNGEVKNAN